MSRPGNQQRKTEPRLGAPLDINLDDVEAFATHQLVLPLRTRYVRSAMLAEWAILRLVEDLEALNEQHLAAHGRSLFTAVKGRVKEESSFLNKLLGACRTIARSRGLSQETLETAFANIRDLAGVRFSCPYFDEVVPAVDHLVRPRLSTLGYGTDLRGEVGYEDKNQLDEGDEFGYRAYHFYLRVPTAVDIYGAVELCVCEVQARTELQHVWADKSHALLYKPASGWNVDDEHVVGLMRQVSNSLRAVDEYLVDIRRRSRGEAP